MRRLVSVVMSLVVVAWVAYTVDGYVKLYAPPIVQLN